MQRKGDKNCCRKTQKEATTDTKRGSEREQRERETTRDRQIRREGFVLVSITCITCSTEESERERQRDRERERERERQRERMRGLESGGGERAHITVKCSRYISHLIN